MLPTMPFPETQTTLALFVFLFTFAYEDGATLLAATLAAAGKLDSRLGFASAFLGIWAGDMGLYLLGSGVGQHAVTSRWLGRFLRPESRQKAEAWFARRGPMAIVMSRFLPGSRLPLYVAAGALKLPARTFGAITGICSVIWVAAIFTAWRFAPKSSASGKSVWLVASTMLLAPWLVHHAIKALKKAVRAYEKYRRWEFWPPWIFYPPVAAMCAWLAVKYRGIALPTVANPSFRNGGIVGESKIDILNALMQTAPEFVTDGYLIEGGNLGLRVNALQNICHNNQIALPFVLKPNVGQRGEGFKLARTFAEAEEYLACVQEDVIVQRYAAGEKEIGIFYYRFPGERRGHIFAVTEKVFPVVTGDGASTLDQLIHRDKRASLIAATYLDRFRDRRDSVLPTGERLRLVEAGNHCQGCIFRDGAHLLSGALRERIDQISQSIPGFFIGRYDIRYATGEDLQRGENFRIIELNGAASEATSIYDERYSVWSAYRTLYKQWDLVFAIGRRNRDLGHRPASALDVLKDWKSYRATSAAYPAAD